MYQNAVDLLHKLMMLLSPEEIRALTTDSQGEQRVSLTEMILKEQGQMAGEAKILPFKAAEAATGAVGLAQAVGAPTETLKVEKAKENLTLVPTPPTSEEVEVPKAEDLGTGMSATLLILEVKEKLKHTQEKLKEKEVLNLYRKSSAIDINQEKLNRNDLKKSSNLGILVNKRQA